MQYEVNCCNVVFFVAIDFQKFGRCLIVVWKCNFPEMPQKCAWDVWDYSQAILYIFVMSASSIFILINSIIRRIIYLTLHAIHMAFLDWICSISLNSNLSSDTIKNSIQYNLQDHIYSFLARCLPICNNNPRHLLFVYGDDDDDVNDALRQHPCAKFQAKNQSFQSTGVVAGKLAKTLLSLIATKHQFHTKPPKFYYSIIYKRCFETLNKWV